MQVLIHCLTFIKKNAKLWIKIKNNDNNLRQTLIEFQQIYKKMRLKEPNKKIKLILFN